MTVRPIEESERSGGEGEKVEKKIWCRKWERGRGVYCYDFREKFSLGIYYFNNKTILSNIN